MSSATRADPDEVGRLALWQNHTDLDRAAREDHIVALHSQIHDSVQPGHTEKVVDITSA